MLLLALPSCAGHSKTDNPKKQKARPNIIYVLAGDLGYGKIGVYGQQKIETPNIDQLARNGMLFTRHYAGSPVCAPSRYMLMTGQHPAHAYIQYDEDAGSGMELFDMENDAKQFNNLAHNPQYQDVVAAFQKRLQKKLKQVRDNDLGITYSTGDD